METMLSYLDNEQSLDLLTAICYMQDKYSFFMSGKNYKSFKRFVESEIKSCEVYEQDYERVIKNIFKRFTFLCKLESLPFALSLAMNAQLVPVDELIHICDMRSVNSPSTLTHGKEVIVPPHSRSIFDHNTQSNEQGDIEIIKDADSGYLYVKFENECCSYGDYVSGQSFEIILNDRVIKTLALDNSDCELYEGNQDVNIDKYLNDVRIRARIKVFQKHRRLY